MNEELVEWMATLSKEVLLEVINRFEKGHPKHDVGVMMYCIKTEKERLSGHS